MTVNLHLVDLLIEGKQALKIAKDCLEFSEVYHATRAVVFLGVKKNSPFERWDEVTLLPEVECSNDGENPIRPPAAPTIVRCFEDTSTPTASDESDHHAGTNMRCLAEDHDFSRKLQSPIAMANTFANRDDLTSIKATLREPRRFISTSRVPEETQAERHALWLSIIQKSYNLVLKYKQKERHLSGVSKADVFRFAVACH